MLIRYIPTILASGLVLFLGIELTLEAVWESAKYLVWSEWLVVMATLFACTFLGFAAGVGVGIGAAFVVYTGWGCFDLVCIASFGLMASLGILTRALEGQKTGLPGRKDYAGPATTLQAIVSGAWVSVEYEG